MDCRFLFSGWKMESRERLQLNRRSSKACCVAKWRKVRNTLHSLENGTPGCAVDRYSRGSLVFVPGESGV